MAGEANIWNPRTLLQLSSDTKRVEERQLAVAGQSVFNLTDFTYVLATGSLAVYKNGLILPNTIGWVETSPSSFTLATPANVEDEIVAVGMVAITGDFDASNLIAMSGRPASSTHLGLFPRDIITDNTTTVGMGTDLEEAIYVIQQDRIRDLSDLGYVYGSGADATPLLDQFLTDNNGKGKELVITGTAHIKTPAWLNAVPTDITLRTEGAGFIIGDIPTGGTSFLDAEGLINLRGTVGVSTATVTANIVKGAQELTLDSVAGIVVDDFVEIDLREQTVDGNTVISRQIARLVRVMKIVGNIITIDYTFPFALTFGAGSKQLVNTDITPAERCTVDIQYKDVSPFTPNIDAGTPSANRDHLCIGVHAWHAYKCNIQLTGDQLKGDAVLFTFSSTCEAGNITTYESAIFGPGEGYSVKIVASHQIHVKSIKSNLARHAVDFSNAGYCKIDHIESSNDYSSGMSTHGISEHDIDIGFIKADIIALADSGSSFGFHSANIHFGEVICDTFSNGYVENLEIDKGDISTEFEVKRGGSYKVGANIELIDFQGRNGRPTAISPQGTEFRNGTIQKFSCLNSDYLHFIRNTMKENTGDKSILDDSIELKYIDVTNVGHSVDITDSCRRVIVTGGTFNTEGVSLSAAYFATTRLEGGRLSITWTGSEVFGNGTSAATSIKMLQLQQFNDNGVNNITANVAANTIIDTPSDVAGENAGVYDIDSISYRANLRKNAPAFAAAYVTSDDTSV